MLSMSLAPFLVETGGGGRKETSTKHICRVLSHSVQLYKTECTEIALIRAAATKRRQEKTSPKLFQDDLVKDVFHTMASSRTAACGGTTTLLCCTYYSFLSLLLCFVVLLL